jgi:phosphoribosyl 1,2-cyclic phosphate phosphodiesterase
MEKSLNKNMIIALGTGTSTGIPMIGCHCVVCLSADHRDQRLRTSLFLKTKNNQNILVDTSTDLRTQLLNNKISAIDSIILTHEHADHLHGIDDIRPLTFGPPTKEIPLFTNSDTAHVLKERFSYIFRGGIPRIKLREVPTEVETNISGDEFFFFNYPHGHGLTMGFIHESFAYIVDCMELSEERLQFLRSKKLDLLIIDCLQRKSHSTHLTVEKSFDYIEKISPQRAGLIHMGHDLSHRVLSDLAFKRFGNKVFPLYDQQKIFY